MEQGTPDLHLVVDSETYSPTRYRLLLSLEYLHILAHPHDVKHLAEMLRRMHHPELPPLVFRRQNQIEQHRQSRAVDERLLCKDQQQFLRIGYLLEGVLQRTG